MKVAVSAARLYRGHLYPLVRHRRGTTAILRRLDDLAYRNILDGNQSREFEFTMKSREDFVPLIYERPVVDAFAEAVGPDSTVLDIGSYHGFYALLAASQPNTDVYAFEPNEANRQELSSNLELNPAGENVTVVPEAVLDENSETTYASSGVKTTMGTGTKRISTVTLDTFCERHELQPDVLKIDVEGAESNVLAGATRTLRGKPTLFIEIHNDPKKEFEGSVHDHLSAFDTEVLMRRESEIMVRAQYV
ncbi:FkbM family methyltransferase [Haloarculaceae archaeon H-GB1-1]|nr:FkbM family methyltransferase [Haloarculaceae archaeon H-GB1-1]